MTQNLRFLFHPRSIALTGISTNPNKFGGSSWVRTLQELGYSGKIYPISTKLNEFCGLRVYPSIRDIPEKVDLTVMSVPAQSTPEIMKDCAANGVKYIQFFTAGFSETGEEDGKKLEEEILQIACDAGIHIIGPNCMGIYSPGSGISWRSDFPRKKGHLGVLSQSGWNSVEIIKSGEPRGVFCSNLISYGNASDLNESDFIEYFISDTNTKVIALYIEGARDGRRFLSTLRKATKTKPVILLKGGRTNAGTRAVASHTSSLAGTMEIWNAMVKQSGAIGVTSIDELMDTVIACLSLGAPKNRNVAVIGSGGGPSVTAADECESAGLFVPQFSEELRKRLDKFIPKEGSSTKNPIDAPFWWEPKNYEHSINAIAESPEIGSLIIQAEVDCTIPLIDEKIVSAMIQSMMNAIVNCGKPTAFVLRSMGTKEGQLFLQKEKKKFIEAGIPLFPTISRAAHAINHLIQYNQIRIKHG